MKILPLQLGKKRPIELNSRKRMKEAKWEAEILYVDSVSKKKSHSVSAGLCPN